MEYSSNNYEVGSVLKWEKELLNVQAAVMFGKSNLVLRVGGTVMRSPVRSVVEFLS